MAHTLTFGSGITCMVNGTNVSSGYTLKNGDTIVLYWGNGNTLMVNEIMRTTETISLSDTDIDVKSGGGGSND